MPFLNFQQLVTLGLYELAVFGKDGGITYDTPITDDVLGYLSEEEIEKTLTDIKNLD